MAPGRAHDLLARLALALATVSAPLVACGGETTDGAPAQSGGGGTGGTGGAAGNAAGGAAGSTGIAGTGGTLGGGGGSSCARPLPEKGPQAFGKACHTSAECPSGAAETCLRPGESPCSGIGPPGPPSCFDDAACDQGTNAFFVCQEYDAGDSGCKLACAKDDECELGRFCDRETGHCERRKCSPDSAPCDAGSFCAPDFTCRAKQCDVDRPCGVGLSCDPNSFTCTPRACKAGDSEGCPETFTCTELPDTANRVCVRTPCTCDTQCGASGYCVGGSCWEAAGTCSGNVACGRPLLVDGAPLLAALLRAAWW